MYGIEILMEEHQNILRLTNVIRNMIKGIIEGEEIVPEDMESIVEVIKNYTDAHHHGKEEEILFAYMLDELEPLATKIIRQGMLVEHDLARSIVRDWEEKIQEYKREPSKEIQVDLIGLAYSYARTLEGHAVREDTVVYPFGERELSEESKRKIDILSREFEEKAEEEGVQEKYLLILKKLEVKYQ